MNRLNLLVVATVTGLFGIAGCSSGGSSNESSSSSTVVGSGGAQSDEVQVLEPFVQTIDWTGRVCESPLYRNMIDTYRGTITRVTAERSCRWQTTVAVRGQSVGDACNLSGTVTSTLSEQGTQLVGDNAYICADGTSDVILVNGSEAEDDINTVYPVSLIFQFQPMQPERDINDITLVPAITELENLTVETQGLVGTNGILQRR